MIQEDHMIEVSYDMNYKGWIQLLIFQKSLGNCMTLDKLNHLYGPQGKMRRSETMTYNVLFFLWNSLKFPWNQGFDFLLWQGRSQSMEQPLKRIKDELYGFVIITVLLLPKEKQHWSVLVSQRTCTVWKSSFFLHFQKRKSKVEEQSHSMHNFSTYRQNFSCIFFFSGGVRENSHSWRSAEIRGLWENASVTVELHLIH